MKKKRKVNNNDPTLVKSDQLVDYLSLGKHIRRLRSAKGYTQEDMGEKTELSASFFGHIERGSRKASIETLVRIARALNCSLDELLADSLPQRDLERAEIERLFFEFARRIGLFEMQDYREKNECAKSIKKVDDFAAK